MDTLAPSAQRQMPGACGSHTWHAYTHGHPQDPSHREALKDLPVWLTCKPQASSKALIPPPSLQARAQMDVC